MLVSSTDTVTDAPNANVLPAIWALPADRLTHKINHLGQGDMESFIHFYIILFYPRAREKTLGGKCPPKCLPSGNLPSSGEDSLVAP